MSNYSYIVISTTDGKYNNFGCIIQHSSNVKDKTSKEIKKDAAEIFADWFLVDPDTMIVVSHQFLGECLIAGF